ncbi:alkaline phosphatase family protein [Streptomyces tubbatahanensis]|uniref:Alkaline phosphatase family protein n=1 Tax=Streptomyces tubbatahanensis TaxID=2923272 RepID=A0ABY3XRJ6_9ACTN|nr:alkaline phosphatase D family protein [Streptomyces tubbatahanensis]UNS96848.1 alkaline phosphatase family protein [Streptomyces tubbatahanensis]
MTGLRLGPLLRYVDQDTATVWLETEGPCEAEVHCEGSTAGGAARTWQVAGHHYALVTVVGLEPGSQTPYRVTLDGEQVWPLADSAYPTSTIRTLPPPEASPSGTEPFRIAFGSCRWAARPAGSRHDPVGPDALDALAQQAIAGGPLPDVLLLLGDQVYADETSERVRAKLAERRDVAKPPWDQVADYEEYTELYYESWLDPEVRWLLSTVPSCMIFDDHDVIDDWNTSEAWQREMRATDWWRERILGGLTSYWVYQHLGNLSPAELAENPVFAAVRHAEDGTPALRAFAERADADPAAARWSYRRDFGRIRLLMVDTRAGRVLPEAERRMVDDEEMDWLHEQVLDGGPGAVDHLLLGSSLPWLLPPAVHGLETWNTALCSGARGARWLGFSEKLRQRADLEHWAAFPRSFQALTELIQRVAADQEAPASVSVLSGDVHHAYVTQPQFDDLKVSGGGRPARVTQLTCSPIHNSIPAAMRTGFRFGWSRIGRGLGRALIRHARVEELPFRWRRTGGPWFGNMLMTLTMHGREATYVLDRASAATSAPDGTPRSGLERVFSGRLSGTGPAARNDG